MKCIYLKQKLNRKVVCKLDESKVIPTDCANCPFKKKKYTTNRQSLCKKHFPDKRKTMKNKTSRLAKLERNRESLFTEDLERCIICGKSPVNKHEIFGGRNRLNSIKYKLVIPLCTCEHHDQVNQKGIHFDKKMRDEWHIKGQKAFTANYPTLDFKDIFKINYL